MRETLIDPNIITKLIQKYTRDRIHNIGKITKVTKILKFLFKIDKVRFAVR
jgi:hypothetical protein